MTLNVLELGVITVKITRAAVARCLSFCRSRLRRSRAPVPLVRGWVTPSPPTECLESSRLPKGFRALLIFGISSDDRVDWIGLDWIDTFVLIVILWRRGCQLPLISEINRR